MLKISESEPSKHSTDYRLEGRVVGPWVVELSKACEKVLTEGRALKLNLNEVEYLDRQGVALLANLRSRGVVLLECPPFIAEQLKSPETR